ncbi:hypothetical protein HN51_069810 [Arachis hypogaea]
MRRRHMWWWRRTEAGTTPHHGGGEGLGEEELEEDRIGKIRTNCGIVPSAAKPAQLKHLWKAPHNTGFRRIIHLHSNVQMNQLQMLQQSQVQQQSDPGMSLHEYFKSPEAIQSLLCDRDKLCQLLE